MCLKMKQKERHIYCIFYSIQTWNYGSLEFFILEMID